LRLALVSPLPPAPTGIADYTLDVARALAPDHEAELYHDQSETVSAGGFPARRIDELPAQMAAKPYDAVIYQVGNGPAHDFMYDWMGRMRGGVVLHDLVLHHAYARRFLESPESLAYAADPSSVRKREKALAQHQAYRAAIEHAYPGQGERLKEAQLNTAGDLLPYAFPLFEPAIREAVGVGVHNGFMAEAVKAARPDLPCVEVAMPVEEAAVDPERIASLRSRLGLEAGDLVVGCFGLVTPEKRVETAARAVARLAELHPRVRLLLAGPVKDPDWLEALLIRTRVRPRALVAGRLDAGDFLAAMALSHAVVHLRYPTARETSAALLRVMAQGRPLAISDLANQSEIPEDTVRRVNPCDEEGDLARALEWMLGHEAAARAMGERAAAFARSRHSPVRTRESYGRLLKSLAGHYPRPLS